MKSNQHTYRILLLLTLFVISFSTFPRKNRTRLQHTYVDYLNQNFCPSKIAIQESEQLSEFREQRKQINLIEISLDQIIEGNISGAVTIRPQLVLTLFAFAVCFISLFILLRRLNKYNNLAIKSGIKMSEQLVMKGTNRKNVIFKGTILVLLLVSAFYAIHGFQLASEVEKGVQKLLCGLINIPNNFARTNQDKTSTLNNYTTYNDYQYQVMSLRQLFNEAKLNLTNISKKNKQQNFLAQTHKISQILKTSEHQRFIISILHTAQLAESLRNQSKFMGALLNYLREVLYWIKGGIVFAQSFLNSYYSIEKIPELTSSLIIQTYQILLICSLGVCILIVFMSLKSTSKQGQIVKYIILILSFCTLLCLSFSSLGTSLIPLPKQICNILAENPNKAALVSKVTAHVKFYQESVRSTLIQLLERISDKSDGNMAFADPDVYENMQKMKKQFKILSQYSLKYVQTKLSSKQLSLQEDIKKYFTYIPTFLQDINQVINIFDKIKLSISKQGDFGRLTLRPFGEYIQLLESNLCDINLQFWQKNTNNLFNYGVISLTIMLFMALYLRNKLKGDYLSANQQQNFEMSAYSVERMSDA